MRISYLLIFISINVKAQDSLKRSEIQIFPSSAVSFSKVFFKEESDTVIHFTSREKLMSRYYVMKVSYGDSIFYIDNNRVSGEEFLNHSLFQDSLNNEWYDKYSIFYCGGKVHEEGRLRRIYFVGMYKQYYHNGKLKMKGVFDENGMRVGTWFFYSENGEVIKTKKFKESHKSVLKNKKYYLLKPRCECEND